MSEDIVYFQKQKRIYPRKVEGRYRSLKWFATAVLLGIYYAVPWLRWNRGENVPDQAVLVDMTTHRGYFFNIEIWPHEVYFFAGILVLSAVGLFFVTSLFGRVWCGYACPQTVWTDLFVWVERVFQGDRNQRMKLDSLPFSFNKLWRKVATHISWLLISLCTGGAWVFYFNDAPTLFDSLVHLKVSPMVWSWVLGLTASTYVMAGFAREQVCIYMCPYSRFQSAMFDRDTLIITYDEKRGEPRGKHKQGDSWEGKGHCIDCTQCVVVCPMGIDIRKGLQMECIACGLCVDACNDVMDKMQLPRGLIRYDTYNNHEARTAAASRAGVKDKLHLLRPRTYYYVAVMTLVGALMLYGLVTRTKIEIHAQHDRNPLYVTLSDGSIRNTYTVNILNKTHEDRSFALAVEGMTVKEIKAVGAGEIDPAHLNALASAVTQFRIMVIADKQPDPRSDIVMSIQENDGKLKDGQETIFISGEAE